MTAPSDMFRLCEAGLIWQTRCEEIPLSTMLIGLKLKWTVSLPLPDLIKSVGRVAMGFQSVPELDVSDRRKSRQYSIEEGMLASPRAPLALPKNSQNGRLSGVPPPGHVESRDRMLNQVLALSSRSGLCDNAIANARCCVDQAAEWARADKTKTWPCINSSLTGRRADAQYIGVERWTSFLSTLLVDGPTCPRPTQCRKVTGRSNLVQTDSASQECFKLGRIQ